VALGHGLRGEKTTICVRTDHGDFSFMQRLLTRRRPF